MTKLRAPGRNRASLMGNARVLLVDVAADGYPHWLLLQIIVMLTLWPDFEFVVC